LENQKKNFEKKKNVIWTDFLPYRQYGLYVFR